MLTLLSVFFLSLGAQLIEEELTNDLVNVQYDQKSAQKAMLLSAIFPGAGQFYADRSSITTYIFPVIEIGLWVGYFSFTKKGDDKEDEYLKYADDHYSRTQQTEVQEDLIETSNNPFYDNHFHLDDNNSQHYYEDIGKYPHYIFGWDDWYNIYAINDQGEFGPDWILTEGDNEVWIGNNPVNVSDPLYLQYQELYDNQTGIYSHYRAEYIEMRQDAEDYYNNANLIGFGILLNHALSSLDALRVTRKYNREYISQNDFKVKLAPVLVNNSISPGLFVSKGF